MDCSTCQEMLDDYGEGTLGTGDAQRVRIHLTECDTCRAHHAAASQLGAILMAAPMREPPTGFTEAVLSRVAREPGPVPSALLHWLAPLTAILSTTALGVGLSRLIDYVPSGSVSSSWVSAASAAVGLMGGNAGTAAGSSPSLEVTTFDLPFVSPLAMSPGSTLLAAGVLALTLASVWGAWTTLERA